MVIACDGWGRGSHGLCARRARRTKSSRPEGQKAGPKGRQLHDQQLGYMINRLSWQWLMFIVHDRQSFIPMINSCDEWSTVFHGNDQCLSYMINSLSSNDRCICVFVYFHARHLGTLFLRSSHHFLFKNITLVWSNCKFYPSCICVFVYLYLCIWSHHTHTWPISRKCQSVLFNFFAGPLYCCWNSSATVWGHKA